MLRRMMNRSVLLQATATATAAGMIPQVRFCSTANANATPSHVFNVFNGRMVRADAPVLKSLEEIGIGMAEGSAKMDVVDPAKLNKFAKDVRANKAEFPSSWSKGMHDSLGFILRNKEVKDPAEQTKQWMNNLTKFARSRRSTGVIASGDDDVLMEEEDLKLTKEQEQVIDLAKKGYNLCISGNAGTGKTVLLRALRRALHKERLMVGMSATTGIAGCHVGGATFHHTLGVTTQGEFMKPKNLLKYDTIIIDEISMMNRTLFETFDEQLRAATGSMQPFGGVQIILCGDFLQLGAIPYKPIFKSHVFQNNFLPIRLTQQVRQSKNPKFSKILQTMRTGTAPENITKVITNSEDAYLADDAVNLLPTNEQVNKANAEKLESLEGEAHHFLPVVQTPMLQRTWTKTAMLKITNPASFHADAFLDEFVAMMSKKIANLTKQAVSFYQLYEDGYVLRVQLSHNEPEAWREAVSKRFEELMMTINQLQMNCKVDGPLLEDGEGLHTPEDEETLAKMMKKHPVVEPFDLKIGAQVLLRANLTKEYVNGSVGTVVDFVPCEESAFLDAIVTDKVREGIDRYIQEVQFQNFGEGLPLVPVVQINGKRIAIPPWSFTVGGDASTNNYGVSALCIPLSLAYAFTVHKVQGLTLVGRVHLELSKMWPCEHLLYVAMSRVRTPDQLTMSCFDSSMVVADDKAVEFDESIPAVADAKIPPYLKTATWKNVDGKIRQFKGKTSAVLLNTKNSKNKQIAKLAKVATKKLEKMREAKLGRMATETARQSGGKQRIFV